MSTLAVEMHPQAQNISFSEDSLVVELVDGRTVIAPLVWFPRLSEASDADRQAWEILGKGEGIHWPKIDEDLSVAGLLAGTH